MPITPDLMAQFRETDDAPNLYAALNVDKPKRRMTLAFGATVNRLDASLDDAIRMAANFRQVVLTNFGRLAYDKKLLPIKVVRRGDFIELHLPWEMAGLIANPEVFLALAEEMEHAAR